MKKGMTLIVVMIAVSLMAVIRIHSATLTAVNETPTLDGFDTGDWTGDPIVTSNGVTMKAAYDQSGFYLLAQWSDSTASVLRKQWTLMDSTWEQSGGEDRISIMWDLGTTPNGAQCATMCHPPNYMYTSEGTVDIWHWKATRSNPMGYSDDKYFIAIQDTTTGGETRLGDGGNNTYDDNADGGDHPVSMTNLDPNSNIPFIVRDGDTLPFFDPFDILPPDVVKIAVGWVDSGWVSGSTVAGYIFERPDGSRGDIRAAGRFTILGGWTVEFARTMTTSGPNDDTRDVQFDPANSYNFTVATWENSGDMSHSTDTSEHTLVFGPLGIGDNERGPGIPSSIVLSQNYPNPFNPSTSIHYSVPEGVDENSVVQLQVFSIHGQLVRTLVHGNKSPGNYTVHWDGTGNSGLNVPSGLYIYRLSVDDISMSKKMTLLK